MNILQNFWRYWKWLCVALMTSFVLLGILAAIVNYFRDVPAHSKEEIGRCIDNGGTWDDAAGVCQSAG